MDNERFSQRNTYPGTEGGPFEILVTLGEKFEDIPAGGFAALLFILAVITRRGNIEQGLTMWSFFLGDWALLYLLPRTGISQGPAKPPTMLLAFLRIPFSLLRLDWWWIIQITGTVLVVYGFWIEPSQISIVHQELESEKFPPGFMLRILHFGDLHIERLGPREMKLIKLLTSLSPDLLLFSGDILSYSSIDDKLAWEGASTILETLSAPLGVYLVPGSPPVDREDVMPKILSGLDIKVLNGESVRLLHQGEVIELIGLSCTHNPTEDGPRLQSLMHGVQGDFTVLLYHSPDLAPLAAELGIDMQFSGHTHGGQVRLPFFGALYTSSLYGKRFECGRYDVRDTTLYVTRGIGLEGKSAPRVRFLCPPELTLWEVKGKSLEP